MSTTGHETEFINVQGLKGALKKGGNKGIFNEATCSTAAATAAKEITTAPKSFSLVTGAKILVTFTNAISVANATLQVGSATAKPIYYHGAALAANLVKAGSVLLLVYDGTSFNIVGDLDTADSLLHNVYIGMGATYGDVMIPANMHSSLKKGEVVSVTAATTGYLWVILPKAYTVTSLMEGIRVPVTNETDIVDGGLVLQAFKSKNTYRGTFGIILI